MGPPAGPRPVQRGESAGPARVTEPLSPPLSLRSSPVSCLPGGLLVCPLNPAAPAPAARCLKGCGSLGASGFLWRGERGPLPAGDGTASAGRPRLPATCVSCAAGGSRVPRPRPGSGPPGFLRPCPGRRGLRGLVMRPGPLRPQPRCRVPAVPLTNGRPGGSGRSGFCVGGPGARSLGLWRSLLGPGCCRIVPRPPGPGASCRSSGPPAGQAAAGKHTRSCLCTRMAGAQRSRRAGAATLARGRRPPPPGERAVPIPGLRTQAPRAA